MSGETSATPASVMGRQSVRAGPSDRDQPGDGRAGAVLASGSRHQLPVIGFTKDAQTANLADPVPNSQFPPG
jgi:hypothetical protein